MVWQGWLYGASCHLFECARVSEIHPVGFLNIRGFPKQRAASEKQEITVTKRVCWWEAQICPMKTTPTCPIKMSWTVPAVWLVDCGCAGYLHTVSLERLFILCVYWCDAFPQLALLISSVYCVLFCFMVHQRLSGKDKDILLFYRSSKCHMWTDYIYTKMSGNIWLMDEMSTSARSQEMPQAGILPTHTHKWIDCCTLLQ